jgi:hypothetical protein
MAVNGIHLVFVSHKRFSKTDDREPVGIYQKWFVIRSIAAQMGSVNQLNWKDINDYETQHYR